MRILAPLCTLEAALGIATVGGSARGRIRGQDALTRCIRVVEESSPPAIPLRYVKFDHTSWPASHVWRQRALTERSKNLNDESQELERHAG